jgi:hypothetical protein
LELEECPHYLPHLNLTPEDEESNNAVVVTSGDLSTSEKTVSFVKIPYGEDLDSDTARRIMRRAPTRVIVLAGDVNSGKTTVLAAMYEKFIDGAFAGYMFAGSETLPGFERRCHLSRVTSDEAKPDTDRTRGQMKLLHLRVKRVSGAAPTRDLLFSDISGEDFEAARNSVEFCKRMPVLKRADRCLLLFDGEALAHPEHRHRTSKAGEMLLRSFLDADMLGEHSIVDVLFTKYDKVVTHRDKTVIEEFIAHIQQDMTKKFSGRLGGLEFHRIAARPESVDVLEPAFGLDKVLSSCVEETARDKRPKGPMPLEVTTGREFDCYLERRLPLFVQKEYQ